MNIIIKANDKEVIVGNTEDKKVTKVPIENAYEGVCVGDKVELYQDSNTAYITKIESAPVAKPVNQTVKNESVTAETVIPKTPIVETVVPVVVQENLKVNEETKTDSTVVVQDPQVNVEKVPEESTKQVIETKNSESSKGFKLSKYLLKSSIIAVVLLLAIVTIQHFILTKVYFAVIINLMYTGSVAILLIYTLIVQNKMIRSSEKNKRVLAVLVSIVFGVLMVLIYTLLINFERTFPFEAFSFSKPFEYFQPVFKLVFGWTLESTYKKPLWIMDLFKDRWWEYLNQLPEQEKNTSIIRYVLTYFWQYFVIIWPFIYVFLKNKDTEKAVSERVVMETVAKDRSKLLRIVGGALIILGCLLPVLSASSFGFTYSMTVMDAAKISDMLGAGYGWIGYASLLAGAAVIVSVFIDGKLSGLVGIVGGALALVLAVYFYTKVADPINASEGVLKLGIGYYSYILGSIVTLFGSYLKLQKK